MYRKLSTNDDWYLMSVKPNSVIIFTITITIGVGIDCLNTSQFHHQQVGLDGNFFDECLRNHFYSCFTYFISLVLCIDG